MSREPFSFSQATPHRPKATSRAAPQCGSAYEPMLGICNVSCDLYMRLPTAVYQDILTRGPLAVRTITDDALRKHVCRVQFNEWRRITDHLVRMGLGQKEFATAAVLMAHCKTSIRQLLVDGETRLPNLVHDADWKAKGDEHDEADVISHHLKMVLHYALRVQHCFHSLEMTCSLRLTPIDSDKLWGFPFDEGQMKLFNPPELRRPRDDKELPSVQLVCDPMLVDNGLHDKGNGKVLTQHAPMSVVTPWVYAGNEAEKYTRDHFKEDVERRRAKRYQREVRREAGLPAEEEIKGGRRRGKTARVRKLEKQKVEALRKMANDLLAEQEKKAKELRDEQKKEAEALRAKQQRKAKELWAKQQAEMNKASMFTSRSVGRQCMGKWDG